MRIKWRFHPKGRDGRTTPFWACGCYLDGKTEHVDQVRLLPKWVQKMWYDLNDGRRL